MLVLIIFFPVLALLFVPGYAGLGGLRVRKGCGIILTASLVVIAAIGCVVATHHGLIAALFVCAVPGCLVILLSTE